MEPDSTPPQTEALAMPRIVRTPGTCGGKPRIDGHRIKVEHIAAWHERLGLSPAEIASTYPTITLAQVHAALAYYYDHKDEIDGEMTAEDELVEELRSKNPSLLAQKLAEHRSKNPLLGLFADEPELMDEVVEAAMKDRESRPLRLSSDG